MNADQPFACPQCGAALSAAGKPPGSTIACPACGQPIAVSEAPVTATLVPQPPSGREVYNVVTDLGAGVNVRLSDNLLQIVCIAVGAVLGTIVGLLVGLVYGQPLGGAIGGGVAGFLLGFFGSGVYLMIYRFVCHARGKHD